MKRFKTKNLKRDLIHLHNSMKGGSTMILFATNAVKERSWQNYVPPAQTEDYSEFVQFAHLSMGAILG